MVRVSYTGEEMDHERLLLWPSGRISEQGGARSHWLVRSPDGGVWEEDMSGTDPGVGRSGSSRFPGGALPTNRELLDWISEARAFARANMHPPIVEPANVVTP